MMARWAKLFEEGMGSDDAFTKWKSPYSAFRMLSTVHCPGAVASSSERQAYVKGAPCLSASSREACPFSPMQKATRVPESASRYKWAMTALSASKVAVVAIFTMSEPNWRARSTRDCSTGRDGVFSKLW